MKRTADIIVSSLCLVILSPFLVAIGFLVRRSSPGPALFHGQRVGKDGKLFKILKFRTMREDPEAYNGPRLTANGDPRVTRIGRFLRDTKINELPQLINVLKGEMSFVGPRPEDPEFVRHWPEDIRAQVLSVRPGITSLASVLFAEEERMLSSENLHETYTQQILPEKLRLDLLYVRNLSLLLDLDILFRTALILIPGLRKASLAAEDMLLGPARKVKRYFSWFILDAAIASFSILISSLIWRSVGPMNVGVWNMALAAIAFVLIFTILNRVSGTQHVQWRHASAGDIAPLIISSILSIATILVLNYVLIDNQIPTLLLFVAGLLSASGFLIARTWRKLFSSPIMRLPLWRKAEKPSRLRVLVIGAGDAGQLTIRRLKQKDVTQSYEIVGIVDDDLTKLGTLVHRVPVVGLCEHVPEIVAQAKIDLILFAIHTINSKRRHEILAACNASGAQVCVVPDVLTMLNHQSISKQDGGISRDRSQETSSIESSDVGDAAYLQKNIGRLAELARIGDYQELVARLLSLDAELDLRQHPRDFEAPIKKIVTPES
jgi:lipopolysaccharide/colanic/teichoic acid biosynthesis glycosyltransferase